MANPKAEGASKSLNKTITDIMGHLGQAMDRPNADLRTFLYERIGDLSERWFRKGFNRGHREARREFEDRGRVPLKLSYDCKRRLSPKQKRAIELKSTIKRKKP